MGQSVKNNLERRARRQRRVNKNVKRVKTGCGGCRKKAQAKSK